MNASMALLDSTSQADLRTYLARADRMDRASARLVAENGVLAVYTAVLHPSGLLDETPTVLGLRTIEIDRSLTCDVVVPIASLADRLDRATERDGDGQLEFGLPAEVNTVTWAGVAPPRGGWKPVDQTDAGTLDQIARAGIAEVAELLPADAGEHIVRRVRSEVWGRGIDALDHVPAGAAFAAHALGFLADPLEHIPVYDNGPWTRLSAARGHVLVKRRGWSLLS